MESAHLIVAIVFAALVASPLPLLLQRRSRGHAALATVLVMMACLALLAPLYQFAVEHQVSTRAVSEVGLYILLFMLLAPLVAKLASVLIEHLDERAATAAHHGVVADPAVLRDGRRVAALPAQVVLPIRRQGSMSYR